jgi:hypothetical protein
MASATGICTFERDSRLFSFGTLEYLAGRAGVRLEEPRNAVEAARLKREAREREQLAALCGDFAAEERALRRECRDWLHRCDAVLAAPAPWSEARWKLASLAYGLSSEFLLPEYTLLCFGEADVRLRYVLGGDIDRARMLEELRWRVEVIA